MKTSEFWDMSSEWERWAVLKDAGYLARKQPEETSRFLLSRTGDRLAKLDWDELTQTQRKKIAKVF